MAGGNRETGSARQVFEKIILCTRHPHLAARRPQPVEQRGPPRRIEVGGHFIEQQHRRLAAMRRHQCGMGEQDGKQQGLLFAGRTKRRSLPLRSVDHREILPMRA